MAKKFNISDVIDIMMDSAGDSDDDFDGYIDEDELLTRMGDEINNDSQTKSDDDDDDDDDGDGDGDGNDNGNVDKEHNGIDIQEVNWSSGCSNDMTNKTPLDFFELLVTDDILDLIVDQTNLYAKQFFEKESPPPRSRVNEWKKKAFTSIELMKFFAMIIAMGVIHYPRLDDYWVTSWPFSSNTFSQIMSRDWFSCILKFLHLNNSEMMPKKCETGYDALYKVRPMLEQLLTNFKCNYNLGRELSIDESMIGFKGRISFIQYMPKKPTKWGLKAYVLADSITGYTYSWILYTGKDSSLDTSCGSVIDATVFRLLEGLENKGHHVYTDNYYSNPTLYTKLKELGYEACGTVRVNRKGMPKEWMKDKKIDKGEVRSKNLGNNLIALQWMDKRLVTMISTVHNDDMVSKRRRTKHAAGGQEDIQKPKMIEEYNSYMGGVDKSDQLLSYYGFDHRSVKWWKRVAFHLLDLSIVNAYVMYRQSKQERYLTHEQFRIKLSKDLLLKVGIYFNDTLTQRLSTPPVSRLTERHFPSKIPEQGKQHQMDCSVCSDRKKGKRKMTIYMCKKCGVALCVAPCFELHHTRVNPKRYL